LKIIADANIPLLTSAFGPLGTVVALPAREITAQAVRGADALLVRSVTRVDRGLLEGSGVRFVGTATIGIDHVDTDYLASRDIAFASAQGSNARSVAEYVLAALTVLAERQGRRLCDQVLGIVGCGNVGGRLARLAEAIGIKVLCNDPPLARQTGDAKYLPIEALAEANIVTFHVPLTYEAPDATYHLADAWLMSQLKRGLTLINSSRGSVADTEAVKSAFDAGHIGAMVIDVWEREPDIDAGLLERADLATPHIAGYSYDGKVNGTRMLFDALTKHFALAGTWDPSALLPPPARADVEVPAGASFDKGLALAIAAAYDIKGDDGRLRAMLRQPPEKRGAAFTALRKDYPVRREFPETAVRLARPDKGLEAALEALGFPVQAQV
jgi:erythronate-4-phosphate dehydrogenase